MRSYQDAFQDAVLSTEKQGLNLPDIDYRADRLMNADRLQKLTVVVKGVFKTLSLEDIQVQSLLIHQELQPIVENVFESPAFYTIGFVHLPPNDYFQLAYEDVSELLKEGQGKKDLELHAWLTLPTMEIVDFSINSTLAAVLENPEIAGRILAAHPEQFKGGLAFHPVLVGDDFLNRLSTVSG